MTDKNDDVLAKLRVASVIIEHLPESGAYNGSRLEIDSDEASRLSKDIDLAVEAFTELLASDEEYDAAKFELAAARQQRFHVGLSRATGDAETDAFHRDLNACSRVKLAIMRRAAAIRACGGGK